MAVDGPPSVQPGVVTFPAPDDSHVVVDVPQRGQPSFSSSVPPSSDFAPAVDPTSPAFDPKAEAAAAAAAACRTEGKVNWQVLALILTGDLLGTGLLTVPHAYTQLGWIPATTAIVALFALTTYSGIRLFSLRLPGVSSYAGLFHAHLGPTGRAYAAFCVHALLFLFVAGSLQVAQASWRALFPSICGAVWVGVVGVVAWIALQARSMPAIGVLGGVAVVSAVVPTVMVIGVLRADVLGGARAPGDTSLWFGGVRGAEGGGAVVALMDLLFAFAGHAVFLELVGEMVEPADFPKALYASQAVLFLSYIVVGAVVYATVGAADWLTSPLSLSLSPATSRGTAITIHSLVILHVTSEMVVDGTVFIRAVQRHLQPVLQRFLHRLKHGPSSVPASAAMASGPIAATANAEEAARVAPTGGTPSRPITGRLGALPPHACDHVPTFQVAPTTDWTPPAILWWALWSALTVIAIVALDLAIPSFDDLCGLAAALIASQTSLAWPSTLAWGRTDVRWRGWRTALGLDSAGDAVGDPVDDERHAMKGVDPQGDCAVIRGRFSSTLLLSADLGVVVIAAAFLLAGTAANVEDIAKNGTGVHKLFSCVLARS